MYRSKLLAVKKESEKLVMAYVIVNERMYLSGILREFAPPLSSQQGIYPCWNAHYL